MAENVYVAFLRGINVGKAKRIAMADLRALVESLGYSHVKTLLNSGNVVFATEGSGKTAAPRIEREIERRHGFSSRVTVISAKDLETIIRENPIVDLATDHARLLAAMIANSADRKRLADVASRDWGDEAIAVGTRAAYLWCPDGTIRSEVLKAVDRMLGDRVTSRNWNTVLKLQDLTRSLARSDG